jgi:hypothetical protein
LCIHLAFIKASRLGSGARTKIDLRAISRPFQTTANLQLTRTNPIAEARLASSSEPFRCNLPAPGNNQTHQIGKKAETMARAMAGTTAGTTIEFCIF